MMQGWIKLHRKISENIIWSDPNYLKLFMYCLFKASHKEHDQLVGNQMIKLEVGQFVTGRKILSEELNSGVKPEKKLSEKSWSRYLKNLERWQMLTIKVTNKYSIVTVVNYGVYQNSESEIDHQSDQQLTNNCPTSDQQLTTNKNVKNVKNEKNNKNVYSEAFEIFYKLYPRKIGKKQAFKNWNTRLKEKVNPDDLITACRNYAKECERNETEQKFIKHLSTFISNSKAYEDYIVEQEYEARKEDGSSNASTKRSNAEPPKKNPTLKSITGGKTGWLAKDRKKA
ncbi:hypothetical protein VQL36_14650 [Chengkuizengella sp. SCS-71B]|uniref:hypothetical protein n=1 Tax=Chengkuizengella sp. SCS-71B TaxID=3115290 RepID=UPI0032C24599